MTKSLRFADYDQVFECDHDDDDWVDSTDTPSSVATDDKARYWYTNESFLSFGRRDRRLQRRMEKDSTHKDDRRGRIKRQDQSDSYVGLLSVEETTRRDDFVDSFRNFLLSSPNCDSLSSGCSTPHPALMEHHLVLAQISEEWSKHDCEKARLCASVLAAEVQQELNNKDSETLHSSIFPCLSNRSRWSSSSDHSTADGKILRDVAPVSPRSSFSFNDDSFSSIEILLNDIVTTDKVVGDDCTESVTDDEQSFCEYSTGSMQSMMVPVRS